MLVLARSARVRRERTRRSSSRGCRCSALALDLDPPTTPEVEALAPQFRRAKLHETVIAFLRALLPEPSILRIEDAHYLDEASADLLAALARELPALPG